jgi:hypothetical protein
MWRTASWLATLAAGVIFAWVLAHWGWRAFGPATVPLPVPQTPERWTDSIVAARIFGRAAAAAAPAALPTAASLGGDARLLGVFAEADGQGYALFRLSDRGPVLVKSGQEIAREVILDRVRPDGVRLRDHGELRDIVLRAAPVALAPAASAGERTRLAAARPGCAPAGYKGPVYRLNAELLSGIASQPDSWKALLAPAPGGLAVRDESGFAVMLGMKAGDRMAVANGIALAGIDDVLTAVVKPLLASQPVRVTGTRDGKPGEWLFLNAGACPG